MGFSTDDDKHGMRGGEGLDGRFIIIICAVLIFLLYAVIFGLAILAGAAVVYAVGGIVYRGAISFERAFRAAAACLMISLMSGCLWFAIASDAGPRAAHDGLGLATYLPILLRWTLYTRHPMAMAALMFWLAISLVGGTVVMKSMIPVIRGFTGGCWAILLVSASTAASLVTLWSLFTLAIGIVNRGTVDPTSLAIVATVWFCAAGGFVLALLANTLAGRRGADTECFARTYGVVFVGCLAAAVLALVLERWNAGLTPMARAIAASVTRNLRLREVWDATRYAHARAPKVGDALPNFLLMLAPGMLALAMSVVLGLGRAFRSLGAIIKLAVLAAAMTLVALVDVGVTGLLETPEDARDNGSPDASARGPDHPLVKAPSPSTKQEPSIHPQVKKVPRHR